MLLNNCDANLGHLPITAEYMNRDLNNNMPTCNYYIDFSKCISVQLSHFFCIFKRATFEKRQHIIEDNCSAGIDFRRQNLTSTDVRF